MCCHPPPQPWRCCLPPRRPGWRWETGRWAGRATPSWMLLVSEGWAGTESSRARTPGWPVGGRPYHRAVAGPFRCAHLRPPAAPPQGDHSMTWSVRTEVLELRFSVPFHIARPEESEAFRTLALELERHG